jgi:hypothetical protein
MSILDVVNKVKAGWQDDKGWIRQGKFSTDQFRQSLYQPVQQIKENFAKKPTINLGLTTIPNPANPQVRQMFSSVSTPEKQAQFNQKPVSNLIQGLNSYVTNRYVAPIAQIPYRTKQLITPGQRLQGGLGLLGGTVAMIPDPIGDVALPAYDYLKGVSAAQKKGEKFLQSYKTGLKSLTGQETTGLGEAVTKDAFGQNIFNMAEFPLILAAIGKVKQTKALNKLAIESESQITGLANAVKNYDKLSVSTQISTIDNLTNLAKKLIPDVVNSKEMKRLSVQNPKQWMNLASDLLFDRLHSAKNPQLNLGYNVRKIQKAPEIGKQPLAGDYQGNIKYFIEQIKLNEPTSLHEFKKNNNLYGLSSEELLNKYRQYKSSQESLIKTLESQRNNYIKLEKPTVKIAKEPTVKLPWEEAGYKKYQADNAQEFAALKAETEPKTFTKTFAEWVGKRESAKTKGTMEAAKFAKVPGNPNEIIKAIENPKIKVTPEQKKYVTELRKTYDKLFTEAQANGIDMEYTKNYLTHEWDRPVTQVAQDYKSAKPIFKFGGNRTLPTYEEGIKMGLKPKYTNPAQILESYTRRLNETVANLELFKKMKSDGLIVSGSKVTGNPDFAPINAPGFPRAKYNVGGGKTVISNWYAPRQIAQQINNIFTPQDYGGLGKAATIGKKFSSGVQDVTLSGGLPKTPANAWTFAQTTKEVLAGRVKSPLTSFVRSLNGESSNKFFADNAKQIVKMQERNIPVSTTFSVDNLIDKGWIKNTFGKNGGETWNKVVNEPTFKRFMPQLQINLFNDVESSLLKKGLSSGEAADQAAQAVKNFYGVTPSDALAKKSSLVKDLEGAVFFAPRYRESMINFWINSFKGLKNPLAPANINNTKFLAGAIMTYLGMNAINKQNTGKNMWENPPTKEDKMLIKTKDGYVGVPFLSSIATIPRLAYQVGKNVVQGNFPEALRQSKGVISSGFRPLIDIATNKDYFNADIYDINAPKKWGDIGLYLAGQYNHPYIRETLNTFATNLSPEVKKKLGLNKESVPAYQTFSKAMELPFRYYNNKKGVTGQDALASSWYYASKDEALKELNPNDKNIYKTLEQKRPDDISQAADIQMNMAEALTLLSNPAVLRAKAKTAIDTSMKTGESLDPFYTLTPEQQQVVLRLKTFYPGDKEKTNVTNENIDWLKPYWTARTAYFDELKAKGIIKPSEPSEEFASPEIQKKLDYYYTLPYGTGERTKYINANPDLVEYWNKKTAITNEKRAELGLTPLAGFNSFGSGKYKKKVSIKKSTPIKFKVSKSATPKLAKLKISTGEKFKVASTSDYNKSLKTKLAKITAYKAPTIKIKKMSGLTVGKKLV